MRISDWSSACALPILEQAEARLFRREAAAVEEVAGGDAGVEMVGADVGIVEADQFGGRTAPEEAIGEAEHHGVVDAQSGRRVDRLPGQPAGCADNLRLAAHPAHALTSTTTRPRTRPWRMSRPSGSNSASVASSKHASAPCRERVVQYV